MGNNRNNNDRKATQVNAALMHAAVNLLQDQQNPKEQYSTRRNAGYTPVAVKTTDDSADAHAWHYTAMSAATFTLSALLGYIATEAIVKRIRGRN